MYNLPNNKVRKKLTLRNLWDFSNSREGHNIIVKTMKIETLFLVGVWLAQPLSQAERFWIYGIVILNLWFLSGYYLSRLVTHIWRMKKGETIRV